MFEGQRVRDGQTFVRPGDNCQQCTCSRGSVNCQSLGPCPALQCTVTETPPGACCPQCKRKSLTLILPISCPENVVCFFYVCCIYLNALQNTLHWKQILRTQIRLLLREQSDLGPYCFGSQKNILIETVPLSTTTYV